ncbi:uncharacterized protein Triagg1_5538 [Trichoderma aggressivum f. europaeum]|uniref:Uncharacterized protein n=1 Tax=Trichoderma aggressivum f. europaeum TaxID=173218 RepID=A0AAE1M0F1_9HYPO|nr:hypothetical protein Triagg1_5538 [Trichoderma aggressivum f. europaeum]
MGQPVRLPLTTASYVNDTGVPQQSQTLSIADSVVMQSFEYALLELAGLPGIDDPKFNQLFEYPALAQMRVLDLWPRLDDTRSWNFCAQMLLSFANQFVQTGENPFIDKSGVMSYILTTAFSVSAAYSARTDATNGIFQRILVTEVCKLATAIPHSSFEQQLAALQALLLYYTLMFFGGDTQLRALAEKQEGLLQRATIALQSQCLDPSGTPADRVAECHREAARRAVVISYLLRGINRVLHYKSCHVICDLLNLPVSLRLPPRLRQSGLQSEGQIDTRDIVTYYEFVQEWEKGRLGQIDEFAKLLLVACKGLTEIVPASAFDAT